jgi:8-amino-7-oxononanoate synthase
VLAAVESAVRQVGFGSGAAALICGQTEIHASAAREIARWKKTEAAVLLPSGYQANHAAIQTLAAIAKSQNRPIRFLVDKLAHASILDAASASAPHRGAVRVFPHNNLDKLSRLLRDSPAPQLDVVITESIFSMDGDAADLAGLSKLKGKHSFILMLDEAHASGVYGQDGCGYAGELGLAAMVDISIVTLSKAMGGIGGTICASRAFCNAVENFGRAFIYTTNIPAAAAAAAQAAIQVLRDEPQRQNRVRDLARRVRAQLAAANVHLLPGDSPILCWVLGSEAAAIATAQSLRDKGLFVTPVRPPTVAPGSSRLRMTLSSQHTDEEIQQLISAVMENAGSGRIARE